MHRDLAAWYHPSQAEDRVKIPSFASWLPDLPDQFGTVVSNISTKLLGVPAGANAKQAVSLRTGIALDHKVKTDDMDDSTVGQILTALLGSPTHMTR